MRISNTITVRRGRAYEIKSVSENGSMLLRPTTQVALKLESVAQPVTVVEVVPVVEESREEITLLPRRLINGSCDGSRGAIGLRKNIKVRHPYGSRMEEYDAPGHDSWKRHRTSQYRCRDNSHESDPNPVHI